MRGERLLSGLTFDSIATRRTANEIESYLAGLSSDLDIDGDGRALASTDGLIYQRYTKDRAGVALTAGARNASARNDAGVKAYLD